MKIKCFKVECEVCKIISSCQIFYNAQGVAKYARVRHYDKRENGKPKFSYHTQSLSYVAEKLGEKIFFGGQEEDQSTTGNIDQQNPESKSKLLMARDVRFTPMFKFHTKNVHK